MENVFIVEAMLGLVSPLLGLPQFVNGDGKTINLNYGDLTHPVLSLHSSNKLPPCLILFFILVF